MYHLKKRIRLLRTLSGLPLIAAALLLIAAALLLIAYNLWSETAAAASSNAALQQILEDIPSPAQASGQASIPAALPDYVLPDYCLNPEMDMPTTEINGKDYIGVLEIPALDLSLPIISQWSYPNLKLSPCCYAGSAYLDNLVIAAHNYSTHFGNIKNLRPGDTLSFTDVDGNVFYYEVSDIEILKPTDTREMVAGDYALTLFTCTYGGQSRVTVRCDRIGSHDFSPAY